MNLLEETVQILKENNKTLDDILWIGTKDFTVDKKLALKIFGRTNYDSGFGAQEVAYDLLVVGAGWWLEREEYDGSEWWSYKELPTVPIKEVNIKRVASGMCDDLTTINEVAP